MKTIRIFLASSEELKEERKEFADIVEFLNHSLEKRGIRIIFEKWEYLDSSMGPEHKQEEYNKKLCDCELCLVMWWTRFGDYTKEELDIAYKRLCEGKNPHKLYVYFKDGDVISTELQAFRDSFPQKYGHFPCHFQNMEQLKADFLEQFIVYQGQYLGDNFYEVKDSQVVIDGKVYVDLKEVPFVGKNEEYKSLIREIKKTQRLLSITDPNDSEYHEYEIDLENLRNRQKTMEESLWSTALKITELSTQHCSERLERAIELFNKGDNKGTLAVLNEEEISHDARHNIKLIDLGEEGRKGLEVNIEELLLRIKNLQIEHACDWVDHVIRLYIQCVDYSRKITKEKLAKVLNEYGSFLLNQSLYTDAQKVLLEALTLYQDPKASFHNSLEHAEVCGNLGSAYFALVEYEKSQIYHKDSLRIFKINNVENIYQSIFISIQYANDLRILGEYESALKQIDYTFLLIENCKEWDIYKERLILRAITSKLNTLVFQYLSVPNHGAVINNLIRRGLALCNQLKTYPNEDIKLSFYEAVIILSIQNGFICRDIYPISFWLELAHSEIDRITTINDDARKFDIKMTFGTFECIYYLNSDRSKLIESYSNINTLFVDFCNHNKKIRVSHFNFLFLSLLIGYIEDDCKDMVCRSIKSIDERWDELSSLKEILDFQILTYNCLTIENNVPQYDIRYVYNVYKNAFAKSINNFLGLGRDLHAEFLNEVAYEVLIPDNNYNEALDVIEDSILLIPLNENYWDSKAEILYRMGNIDEALALATKVYKKNPRFYPKMNEFLYDELCKIEEWRKLIENNTTCDIIKEEMKDSNETEVTSRINEEFKLPECRTLHPIKKNGKYGFADESELVIIPCEWNMAFYFHEDVAIVYDSNGKCGFIDKHGRVVIPCQWKEALSFFDGLAAVRNDDNKWGYIDKTNKVIISFEWNDASIFTDGLAYVKDSNNHYGYIDTTGTIVVPCKWKRTERFSEGLAAVLDEENKWGFIDKTGKVVIPCQWDSVEEFQGGLAKVRDNKRKYWYIDSTGEVVGEIKYNT